MGQRAIVGPKLEALSLDSKPSRRKIGFDLAIHLRAITNDLSLLQQIFQFSPPVLFLTGTGINHQLLFHLLWSESAALTTLHSSGFRSQRREDIVDRLILNQLNLIKIQILFYLKLHCFVSANPSLVEVHESFRLEDAKDPLR